MNHNPYAPPSAPVQDVPEPGSIVRVDPNVDRACRVMWLSFGISVVSIALELLKVSGLAMVIGAIIGGIFGCAIAGALAFWAITKLRAGRNWMRLLVTTVTALGVLIVPLTWNWYQPYLLQQLASPLDAVITAVQWLLGLAATILINTRSARLWFGTMKKGSAHVA